MDDRERKIHSQLLAYLKNILLSDENPAVLSSTRAMLKSKYNTPEHASKLYSHYKSKPKLRSYTLEKELPRMDYVVHVNDGEEERKLTTTNSIQHFFTQNKESQDEIEDIILRASNQSIFADMMDVLTGDHKLIRPLPFMVTGVVSHCQFHIDLRDKTENTRKGVTARSTLLVSMPSGNVGNTGGKVSNRLNLAKIHTHIQFYPSTDNGSQVQYEICSVEPLLQLPRDDYLICRATKSLSRDLAPSSNIVPREDNQNSKVQEYQVSPIMFLCSQAMQHVDTLIKEEFDKSKKTSSSDKPGKSIFQFRMGQVQTRLRFDSAKSA
eukprot:CAMPEP_0185730778 /NCGR_PEP_ID=MMETSP1171-20130828/11001_1 /TAXON_ID=374046 /ORGANISM="Helicotheca tamensis, Strain CCMP826" /LENGTH=322 /DNA_ID=CAMNT_0028399907 /DNA_START=67 /DNA_END=1035 /DNA_ORIENTATION=-